MNNLAEKEMGKGNFVKGGGGCQRHEEVATRANKGNSFNKVLDMAQPCLLQKAALHDWDMNKRLSLKLLV